METIAEEEKKVSLQEEIIQAKKLEKNTICPYLTKNGEKITCELTPNGQDISDSGVYNNCRLCIEGVKAKLLEEIRDSLGDILNYGLPQSRRKRSRYDMVD